MGWREDLIVALRSWRALEDRGASAPSWTRVGSAVRGREPGEFVVDIRGSQHPVDHLQAEDLRLGESDRRTAGDGYSVMEIAEQAGAVRVRVAEFAEPTEPTLWLLKQPPTFLIDSLIDGIAGITDERLAGALARAELGGRLAPIGRSDGVLLPRQQLAYRACLGTGLWMVWGPPGTGKTSVLTRAIEDLMDAGKRILLVSATNIAVDNVVVKVASTGQPVPGRVVRVGTPHLKEVADNTDVSLPMLVGARLDDLVQQRNEVARTLAGISERAARRSALERALAEFDPATYQSAERRLADPAAGSDALASRMTRAEQNRAHAVSASKWAADNARAALQKFDDSANDIECWGMIDALSSELAQLRAELSVYDIEVERAFTALERAKVAAESYADVSRWERFRDRKTRGAVADHIDQLEKAHRARIAERAAARAPFDTRIRFLQGEITRLQRTVGVPRDEVQRIKSHRRDTDAERVNYAKDLQRAEAELRHVERESELTKQAQDSVRSARRQGYPTKYAELEVLRVTTASDDENRSELEKRHRMLEEQYQALARDAQGEIIRSASLVATTLARFRTHPAVRSASYDVVLVDEVGAAHLPDVLAAVAAAQHTAVLLGDFMQLGPVIPTALRGSERPDIQRWLLTEVFDHCGVDSAERAHSNAGCIALDVQHRFGPTVMELANRIAYGGMLQAGAGVEARAAVADVNDAEIVLVDTDDLADLGQIYRAGSVKGWWPAGVLLSRAIAEMHAEDGATIGVVTPYSLQADATLESMREIERGASILAEVGTAHRFQGREFGVVIFDTVESADGKGWMGQACRGPGSSEFARNGLRLFTVAATRVQERLYVLASRKQVEAAGADTAFGALAAMLAAGVVRTLSASDLIAPFAARRPLGPVGSRLSEVLSRHIEVTDIQDERSFYETFESRLSAASESIWIWAPWVANRMRTVLPALKAAADRGVRIVVFVRDPGDPVQQRFQDEVDQLAAVVDAIVCVHEMHQKIIVIDTRTVILGSLNPLSHSTTRDVMLTMQGSHFAAKLLKEQRARTFSSPPTCTGCRRKEVDLKRRKNGDWYWRCRNRDCPERRGNRAWTKNVGVSAAA